ncbi:fibronectin type III domain-containing protein [Mangrovimonas sp. ST2L15]|uniref:fibronectin type III domain-containing protein n=1 Tax=Mangrovimonas sp. ST2L15 TaxID=1645916 RepID=UPI0009EB77D2|nr:fibronectin type III domain-containing protein [Mangrovimonas sp. ST2L15]
MKRTTLFVFMSFMMLWHLNAQVTIGSGTLESENAPFEPWYGYSYTQTVYLADEINASGEITGLQWYYSGTSALPDSQSLVIYLAESTRTEFASTTDWEPIASFTQVYSGGITVEAGVNGWVQIIFDTPFTYSGTDNLLIAVEENMPSYDSSGDDFYNTEVATNRSISHYSDGTNADPASPPTANNIDNTIANVILDGITQACPNPADLTAGTVEAFSAELSWTENGSATAWNLEVVEAGTAPTGTGNYTADANPYTVTSLNPGTDYEYYVQADCGDTDGLSGWIGPFSFTTLEVCPSPSDLTVNSTGLDSAELTWTENGSATAWNLEVVEAGSSPTGTGNYTADANPYTVTGLMAGTNYEYYVQADCGDADGVSNWIGPFAFDTQLCDVSEQCEYTFVMTDSFGDGWNGNSMTISQNGVDVETITLSSGSSGEAQVALCDGQPFELFWNTGGSWSGEVGIVIQAFGEDLFTMPSGSGSLQGTTIYSGTVNCTPPSCEIPTDLTADNITAFSAELSWTDSNTGISSWNIEVVEAGTAPTGVATDVADTNTAFEVSDLSAITEYAYYVQANCGDENGVSNWAGPFLFTTTCDVFLPYYLQEFDTIIPECWDEANDGDPTTGPSDFGAGSWTGDGFANVGFSGAYKINLFTTGKSDWIISPEFDLTGGPWQFEIDVAFMQFASSTTASTLGSDDEVQVLITTDGGATWTPIFEWDNTTVIAVGGEHFIFDLTPYSDMVVQFGIWGSEGTVNDPEDVDVSVDNFEIREIPTCPEPVELSATNLSLTSTEISWVEFGTAEVWNVEYGPAGFTPGSGEGTVLIDVTSPHVLEGLDSDTSYDFYVQADCGEGDVSIWSGPGNFYTGYCESVPTSNDGQGVSNTVISTTSFPSFGDVTYENHTDTVVNIFQGILANCQVTFATGFTYDTNIWIDFNDNLVFEADELVFDGVSTNQNPTTLDASFVVPADAPLGEHRMRIGTADSGQSTPNPCYNGSWGVTLDFTVNIIELTCVMPEVEFSYMEDCDNLQGFIDVVISDIGDAESILVSNNVDATTIQVTEPGTYQMGPFTLDQSVFVTVENEQDSNCTINSPTYLTTCPTFCLDALPICASDIWYPSITGDQVAPDYLDYGCLGSQPDPQWNTIIFDEPGDYQFSLDQTTGDGGTGTGLDIDFIVWGPFDSQDAGCFLLTPEFEADCSYSATASETINLNGVQAGDLYVILITNFSQQDGFYNLSQDSGPANGTNCEVVCDVVIETVDGVDVTMLPEGESIDFCGVETVTLVSESPYADTFDLYNDGIYVTTNTTGTFEVSESGSYFVIAYGDICEGTSTSATVMVNLFNLASINEPADMEVCDDASNDGFAEFDFETQTAVIIGEEDPSVYNVTYYVSQEDADAATNELPVLFTNTSSPQTIYVRVEDASSDGGSDCYVVTSFEIMVNPLDDASFTLTATCDGAIATVSGTTGGSFVLNPDLGDGAVVDPATGTITGGIPGAIYTVDYTTTGVCPATTSETVVVLPQEDASFTLEADCYGASATITGDVGGIFAFDEFPSDDALIDATTGEITGGSSDTTYVISYTTSGPCPASSIQSVTTYAEEDASFEMTATCDGGIADVYGDLGGTFEIVEPTNTDAVIDSETGEITGGPGGTEFTVSYTTSGPCPATEYVTVMSDTCLFPEVVTPNGDGSNDSFDLTGFGVSSLEIFNRYGTKVYSFTGAYTDEFRGVSDDGDELPTGTYFYVVKYKDTEVRTDWFYITREQ